MAATPVPQLLDLLLSDTSDTLRRRRTGLACGLGYLAIAVCFFWPLFAHFRTHILSTDGLIEPGQSDAFNALWSYWWVQKAVLGGKSPLYCDWIFPPGGADLRWHTLVILPAILTIPARWMLGVVGGYNVMVLGFLIGGASVFERFLRVTLGLSAVASFLGGALFGFAPYFVYKAHCHPNLIGGVFWGAAIATLVGAYRKGDFTLRRGLVFGAAIWATFWTSFVEFALLGVALASAAVFLELGAFAHGARFTARERLRFLVPAALGAVSLFPFLGARDASTVRVPMVMPFSPRDLLEFPRLSVLSALGSSSTKDFWGTYAPVALVVPAIYGIVASIRGRAPLSRELLACLAVCAACTFDVLGVPSAVIRSIPFGAGLRFYARFFPFALFFLTAFAAIGVDRLLARVRSRRVAVGLVTGLACVAAVEMFPAHLWITAPHTLAIAPEARRALDPTKSVFVVPRGEYRTGLDTYQVDLDLPFVKVSYLAREDHALALARIVKYDRVYRTRPGALDDPELVRELRELGVGYMLLEDGKGTRALPPGHAIPSAGPELLWVLDGTGGRG